MTLKGHENWVRDLVFHPLGKLLISVGDDYAIRVWDLAQRRVIKSIENAHDYFVSSLAFSNALGIIATCDVDSEAKTWALR
jgi:platelet-activating factor acetylhydrolase IB subunit alpha